MNFPPFEQFEKENNVYKQKCQVRPKAYSQLSKPPKHTKAQPYIYHPQRLYDQNYQQTSPMSSHKVKAARYQPTQRVFNNHNERTVSASRCGKDLSPKYEFQKYDQYEKVDSYNYAPKFSRTPPKYTQASSYVEKSSVEVSENSYSADPTLRKELGRTKGFQLKMNNITLMNDKISNLLSMVKNDRYRAVSNKKSEDSNHSPSNYGEMSPMVGQIRDRKRQRMPSYQGEQYSPQNKYEAPYLEGKYLDKSHRLKTTITAYQDNENSYEMPARYAKCQKYNEQDTLYRCNTQKRSTKAAYMSRDTTGSKNQSSPLRQTLNRDRSISGKPAKRQTYEYRQMKAAEQPIRKDFPSHAYQIDLNSRALDKYQVNKDSLDKYNKLDEYEYVPKFKGALKRQEKSEQALIPLSHHNQRTATNSSIYSTRMIDDKIQKLKDRILDSEVQAQKYEKNMDLTLTGYSATEKESGKIYRRCESSPQKKFSLKVLPVPIDRQQVVKLAFKLFTQAEIDLTSKPSRLAFLRQQDEDKWHRLQHEVKSKGVRLSKGQLQQLVVVSPEQLLSDDLQTEKDRHNIAYLLGEAQKYWQREVLGCCDARVLKRERFSVSELDQLQKGYLSDKDIASFVNLYTGKSLQAKDISLIFRRLKFLDQCPQKDGISYETFMRALSH